MANKLKEAVDVVVQLKYDRIREEAHTKNQQFLDLIDEGMKKVIKEQVKKEVSKITPKIEKLVNEQLESEVLVRSSKEAKTSHAVAANLSELELKKILIDKMEANNSINRPRVGADDDQEPSAGTDRGSKRRRSGKEPESTSAPREKTTTIAGKTTTGSKTHKQSASQSAPVEETMQSTDPPAGPNIPAPDPRPMEELLQAPTDVVGDAIVVPFVLASQFELKIRLLNLVTAISFHGFENDDPHSHIRRAAWTWLEKEPPNSITSWNDLVSKFVNKFFLPSRTTNLRNEITRFQQRLDETFSEAWDQFKDLLNKCPHHGILAKAIQERPQGALPSDTVPNPRGEIKAITTRSGSVLAGPSIPPPTLSSSSKEVERDPKTIADQVLPEKPSSTYNSLSLEFNKLYFNISFAEALALMPKYTKMLKDHLYDKEKLLGLENTSLTENCSAVLLKRLPEKLEDPGKFLIPCDFLELKKCMALADLGASINLMPLSVWKKLMLPELVPTRMTLELANRSVAYTAGRPFLRMARALVDVYREELILRDGDEKLIFHADNTSKHPHKHGNESNNMNNFIDITCEDRFQEVLKIKKSNHPLSGSTTPPSDSFPSLTPFKTSDSLLEEFAYELTLLEPFPLANKDDNFFPEVDLREIEYLLNRDPSTDYSPKTDIDIIDPILEVHQ
ncbi:reverse transcriptase domain-containing protein [Tanacetum coccineum]